MEAKQVEKVQLKKRKKLKKKNLKKIGFEIDGWKNEKIEKSILKKRNGFERNGWKKENLINFGKNGWRHDLWKGESRGKDEKNEKLEKYNIV